MTEFPGLAASWFGPMFDDGPGPEGVLLILGCAAVAWLVGVLVIRRILDPGPLARGEARWRYRDPSLKRRVGAVLTASQWGGSGRTRGWWATRIEFAIAIALIAGLPALLLAQPTQTGGGMHLGPWVLAPVVGYAGMLVGLAWMVRIYRAGLRNDSEATWRHRDRRS